MIARSIHSIGLVCISSRPTSLCFMLFLSRYTCVCLFCVLLLVFCLNRRSFVFVSAIRFMCKVSLVFHFAFYDVGTPKGFVISILDSITYFVHLSAPVDGGPSIRGV